MTDFVAEFDKYLEEAGLTAGYLVQYYQWDDAGVKDSAPVLLIQPAGGSRQVSTLSAEHYLNLAFVSNKKTGFAIATRAREVLAHVRENPVASFGYLEALGSLNAPTFTEDNKIVIQVMFRIVDCE